MDTEEYAIEWVDGEGETTHGHQIICESRSDELIEENNDIDDEEEYLVGEEIIPSTEIITISNSLDQIAAENLIYMAQDGSVAVMGDLIEEQVEQVDNADYNEQPQQQYFECQVTEEVITDDWVQQQGGERVEVHVDQLTSDSQNEEVMVPLPTDEYTTLRPYPCDFCSRRFRKKANLMNHMIAHKNDRPNICNLCGARYICKTDLLDHLKVHAQMPDTDLDYSEQYIDMRGNKESDLEAEEQEISSPTSARKYSRPRKKITPTATLPVAKRKYKKGGKRPADGGQQEQYPEDIQRLMDAALQHESYARQSVSENQFPIIDARRPYVCKVSGISFARGKALTSHLQIHGDSAFECETCSDIFWTIEKLQKHQLIHLADQSSNSEYEPEKDDNDESDTDFKFGDYYCNICGMSFHRVDLLKRHAKTHKQNDASSDEYDSSVQHCCNVCGKKFAEALDLLAHAEAHARILSHKCMLCGETFLDETTIKSHISVIHANELTKATCTVCGKHCKDSRTLLKHSWDHSRQKNHSCTKCGKTFHNKARLKRHMQSHRNKTVSCDICNETFPDGRSLMNHRHSHTNLSGRQFPCNECGKTFGSRSSQQIHMRIHTGERPYGCRFCWKAFADGGTLRKHERIHTGEKPYACPVCPRAFNQRVVLREHIRSHHSAADLTYGTADAPYYCTVCGDTFKTPQQIIQHLIEHSDSNTVAKRQPAVGPRKYKRRRKLKPEELERLRKEEQNNYKPTKRETSKVQIMPEMQNSQTDDSDEMLSDYDEYEKVHTPEKRTRVGRPTKQRMNVKRERKTTFNNEGGVNSVFNCLDTARNEMMTKTTSSPPSRTVASPSKGGKKQRNVKGTPAAASSSDLARPKMIHTKKTRIAIDDGKRKTRTLVTRTETNDKKPISSPRSKRQLARNAAQTRYGSESTSRNMRRDQQEYDTSIAESNLLLELSKKRVNYNPDVVSDLEEILRSPIKTKDDRNLPQHMQENSASEMIDVNYLTSDLSSSQESTSRSTRASKRISNRQVTKPASSPINIPKISQSRSMRKPKALPDNSYAVDPLSINIKVEKEVEYVMTNEETEVFTCEMCSAVFNDRAQLLVHVPIHI